MMTGKEEFDEQLAILEELSNGNPCNMPDPLFRGLAHGLRALISSECEGKMSQEEVAEYFHVSVRTIRRWESDESLEFPKGHRHGHRELSYDSDKIVRWGRKHIGKIANY